MIGILGAKDGVGCTTIAVNLAITLKQETGKKVLLLDLDQDQMGDAAFHCGSEQKWKTIEELVPLMGKLKPQLLSGFLSRHPKGIEMLALCKGGEPIVSDESFRMVLNFLSEAYDFLVLDLGSRWNRFNTEAIRYCSEVWLIGSGDFLSLMPAHKKLDLLQRAYFPGDRIRFLVNQWSAETSLPAETIAEKTGRAVDLILSEDSKRFAQLIVDGTPIVVGDLRHPWTKTFEKWVAERVGLEEKKSNSPLSLQWPSLSQTNSVSSPNSVSEKFQPIPQDPERDQLKEEIIEILLKKVNPRDFQKSDQLREQTRKIVLSILDEMAPKRELPADRQRLVEEVLNEALGLGPLEDLMADPTISEIMAIARNEIYVERKGRLEKVSQSFTSDKQMMRAVERIVAPIGRRIDESSPMVDARLADGSRVNIVIPPLALKGPTITIRRFAKERLKAEDLVRFGALTQEMSDFLKACISSRLNVIVSGGTGSGKTTLLNVLSSFIPNDERIVTIEDAAELQMQQEHVVRLESRPANIEGRGAIEIRDLVKNSLRMRPDRIVVGECRGGEALDMLQAMNTGHDGSLTTLHANSPRDAMSRLETLVMFAGIDLPSRAIREQITSAVHLIVQLKRLEDGSRKVVQITEVTGMEGEIIVLQDIFTFKREGIGKDGKVLGELLPTGFIPKNLPLLQQRGTKISVEMFQ